ncbi:pilus assembly protein TadG-related protein [Alteribacillus iranensis]|uniref:Putative Flp pilus-assembly TadE/G-like n=1 Tax=Alteribacillus iranensis TaxID=930128 RepID=A0A1I2EVE6_9BACI|nr:pilus assembly protein TadG-related protein [Alteribacillus iranensis]SFE96587.1 Putative Flp pilus-assembly TadE/G-like [Alteribacillus iranensis]
MRRQKWKLHREERGNAIILMAFALMIAITFLGVVIDGGHLYVTKSHLQKTANAAALSGSQELTHSEGDVREVVNEVLEAHEEIGSLGELQITMEESLTVNLEKNVPLFFSSLFGIEMVDVRSDATAELGVISETTGAVPFGIRETTTLNYGETYSLKVDSGDATGGNFGILALEGPGARVYEETLREGFQETLRVGDVVRTQTGNISGPTRDGVNYRMNDNCGMYDRDCDRIVTVVVFRPIGNQTNYREVEVRGFAYFYLLEQMDRKDDSVRGKFIKWVGSGAVTGGAADRGAYSARLTY